MFRPSFAALWLQKDTLYENEQVWLIAPASVPHSSTCVQSEAERERHGKLEEQHQAKQEVSDKKIEKRRGKKRSVRKSGRVRRWRSRQDTACKWRKEEDGKKTVWEEEDGKRRKVSDDVADMLPDSPWLPIAMKYMTHTLRDWVDWRGWKEGRGMDGTGTGWARPLTCQPPVRARRFGFVLGTRLQYCCRKVLKRCMWFFYMFNS